MKRSNLQVMGLFVVVFVLGGLSGAGGVYAHFRGEGARRVGDPWAGGHRARFEALSHALDLDPGQKEHVEAILGRHRESGRQAWRKVMDSCGEPMRRHKAQLDAEIRSVLRADQHARFDALSREQEARFFEGRDKGPR